MHNTNVLMAHVADQVLVVKKEGWIFIMHDKLNTFYEKLCYALATQYTQLEHEAENIKNEKACLSKEYEHHINKLKDELAELRHENECIGQKISDKNEYIMKIEEENSYLRGKIEGHEAYVTLLNSVTVEAIKPKMSYNTMQEQVETLQNLNEALKSQNLALHDKLMKKNDEIQELKGQCKRLKGEYELAGWFVDKVNTYMEDMN